MKKCVFRNFEKFKGKRMCQRFFFNKVTDNFLKMLSVLPEKFCTRFGLDFSGLPTIA